MYTHTDLTPSAHHYSPTALRCNFSNAGQVHQSNGRGPSWPSAFNERMPIELWAACPYSPSCLEEVFSEIEVPTVPILKTTFPAYPVLVNSGHKKSRGCQTPALLTNQLLSNILSLDRR